jgi:hypothetical protein
MKSIYRNEVTGVSLLARILPFLVLMSVLVFPISSPAAPRGPKSPQQTFQKITDVSAVSVTISVGSDGNSHLTYTINDSTKVTLNGAPANARDLRAGMVANIETGSDGKIALTVIAKDPPAHPARHRVG